MTAVEQQPLAAKEDASASPRGRVVAFLCSRYPAVSHTFVLREIAGLRGLGFRIVTASINEPDRPPARLTEEEAYEAGSTLYIKAQGTAGALTAHLSTLLRAPLGYFRGLAAALRYRPPGLRALAYQIFYFTEALIAGRWMQGAGANHLHVHFGTPAATVGLLVKETFQFGFSLTIHGPDEFYDVTAHSLRRKFERADFICTIGQFARSQVIRLLPPDHHSKVEVTPLGIVPDQFRPRVPLTDAETFRVVCVGRLVPEKGQRVLLDAVAKMRSAGWPVILDLIGDGPDRPAIEQRMQVLGLSSAVTLHGAQNPDRIPGFLNSASVFVLASFAEGIPVSLMEAMAMEVPCVSTFVNGIPELIEHGVNGLLVAPGDVDALVQALQTLILDRQLREHLARAGREKVLQKYNLTLNHQKLAEVFARRLA